MPIHFEERLSFCILTSADINKLNLSFTNYLKKKAAPKLYEMLVERVFICILSRDDRGDSRGF